MQKRWRKQAEEGFISGAWDDVKGEANDGDREKGGGDQREETHKRKRETWK